MEELYPYQQQRVLNEVSKSLDKKIKTKQRELTVLKAKNAINKVKDAVTNFKTGIYKKAAKSLPNRQITKDSNKVTVVENQPVYTEDKSRFFKKAWEVQKKQLFFD